MKQCISGEIGGRKTLYFPAENGPVFLWADMRCTEEQVAALYERAGRTDFGVFCYDAEDWDRDYSPWPAQAGPERFFSGGAGETLRVLINEAVPLIRSGNNVPLYLMGYSLAGLFSLYAMYETDVFDGAVCCSASMWYPGWREYAEKKRPYPGKTIYLSLGGKEAKTADPLMSTIETAAKAQEKRLKEDPDVRRAVLQWMPGGHFADSVKRLAAGVGWILTVPGRKERK